jgi:hypothetical protein
MELAEERLSGGDGQGERESDPGLPGFRGGGDEAERRFRPEPVDEAGDDVAGLLLELPPRLNDDRRGRGRRRVHDVLVLIGALAWGQQIDAANLSFAQLEVLYFAHARSLRYQ